MATNDGESIADLVRSIQAERKMSRADIAEELGRSPRMVSKLVNEESKGETFRDALESLRDTGAVERRPARRRNGKGEIVPVRAKIDKAHPPATEAGQKVKAPTVVPEDTAGRYIKKAPNRYSSKTTYAKNGNRIHDVTMNKNNAESRKRGMDTIKRQLRSVARSQSHTDKKVTFTVTLANGRQITVGEKGGYYSSDALKAINGKFKGDVEAWVRDRIKAAYKGKKESPHDHKFTGFRMNVSEYTTRGGQAANSRKRDG